MGRTQLACYSLMASAFVLGGLLIMNRPGPLAPTAQAEMVVHKDTLTMLTARTRPDEEALFILDSLNEMLLIYRIDIAKKQMELAASASLQELFGADGNRKEKTRR